MLSRLVALPCAVPRAQKPFNPTRPQQPGARASRQVTRVAYSDNTTLEGAPIPTPEATAEGLEPRRVSKWDVDADEAKELELDDLDAAQENLLHWALFDAESQDDGIDEMVDYGKFGDEEYEELFEDLDELYDAAAQEVKIGDKILGTVYEIDDDGAYVEIGQKASGFVPISEVAFTKLKTPLEVLRVGMKREFMVVEDADDFGQTILSLAAMEATVFWQRIRQLQEEDVSVNCTVESANKGGLLVKYGPYEGFIPVSQFGPSITPETMETLIGSELPVKFLEIDEERERLVMSNKRASGGMTSIGVGPNVRIGDVLDAWGFPPPSQAVNHNDYIVVRGQRSLIVLDAINGTVLRQGPSTTSATVISAKGNEVISGCEGGFLKWHNLERGDELCSTKIISAPDLLQDEVQRGESHITNYSSRVQEPAAAPAEISCLAVSQTSTWIAAAAARSICVYGPGGEHLYSLQPTTAPVTSIVWLGGSLLAAACGSSVWCWELGRRSAAVTCILETGDQSSATDSAIFTLASSPNLFQLAAASPDKVCVWNIQPIPEDAACVDHPCTFKYERPDGAGCQAFKDICWDSQGRYLAVNCGDSVKFWEIVCQDKSDSHYVNITSLAFQGAGPLMAIGCSNGLLKVLDLQNCQDSSSTESGETSELTEVELLTPVQGSQLALPNSVLLGVKPQSQKQNLAGQVEEPLSRERLQQVQDKGTVTPGCAPHMQHPRQMDNRWGGHTGAPHEDNGRPHSVPPTDGDSSSGGRGSYRGGFRRYGQPFRPTQPYNNDYEGGRFNNYRGRGRMGRGGRMGHMGAHSGRGQGFSTPMRMPTYTEDYSAMQQAMWPAMQCGGVGYAMMNGGRMPQPQSPCYSMASIPPGYVSLGSPMYGPRQTPTPMEGYRVGGSPYPLQTQSWTQVPMPCAVNSPVGQWYLSHGGPYRQAAPVSPGFPDMQVSQQMPQYAYEAGYQAMPPHPINVLTGSPAEMITPGTPGGAGVVPEVASATTPDNQPILVDPLGDVEGKLPMMYSDEASFTYLLDNAPQRQQSTKLPVPIHVSEVDSKLKNLELETAAGGDLKCGGQKSVEVIVEATACNAPDMVSEQEQEHSSSLAASATVFTQGTAPKPANTEFESPAALMPNAGPVAEELKTPPSETVSEPSQGGSHEGASSRIKPGMEQVQYRERSEQYGEKSAPFREKTTYQGRSQQAPAWECIPSMRQPADVFIGNLAPSVGEDDLHTVFGQFGSIFSIQVIRDRETGASRGFGFITFTQPSDAAMAMMHMNGASLMGPFQGRVIRVMPSRKIPYPGGGRGAHSHGGGRGRGFYGRGFHHMGSLNREGHESMR
eukprot:gene9722-7593_t